MKRFSLYTGLPIRGNEGKVYPLYHQRERKKSNNLVYPPKVNDTINSPTHLFAGLTQAKVKILKGVNLSCIEVSIVGCRGASQLGGPWGIRDSVYL